MTSDDDRPGGTLIGLSEFAKLAGVSYPTMWRRCNAGDLPDSAARAGSQRLWRLCDVVDYCNNRRAG